MESAHPSCLQPDPRQEHALPWLYGSVLKAFLPPLPHPPMTAGLMEGGGDGARYITGRRASHSILVCPQSRSRPLPSHFSRSLPGPDPHTRPESEAHFCLEDIRPTSCQKCVREALLVACGRRCPRHPGRASSGGETRCLLSGSYFFPIHMRPLAGGAWSAAADWPSLGTAFSATVCPRQRLPLDQGFSASLTPRPFIQLLVWW